MADRPHPRSVRRAGAGGAVGGNLQGLPAHPGAQHLHARRRAEEDARGSSRRLSAEISSRQAASLDLPPAWVLQRLAGRRLSIMRQMTVLGPFAAPAAVSVSPG